MACHTLIHYDETGRLPQLHMLSHKNTHHTHPCHTHITQTHITHTHADRNGIYERSTTFCNFAPKIETLLLNYWILTDTFRCFVVHRFSCYYMFEREGLLRDWLTNVSYGETFGGSGQDFCDLELNVESSVDFCFEFSLEQWRTLLLSNLLSNSSYRHSTSGGVCMHPNH